MRPLLAAVLGVVITAGAAGAAARELVLLPAAPLIADGERAHHLRLYLVSGGKLVPGSIEVKAALGEIVAPPAREPDGGFGFHYRPPRVQAPTADQLTVLGPELRRHVQVLLEPTGSLRLSMEASPDPLVLGSASRAVVRLHVRDPAGRPARAARRLGARGGRGSPPEASEPGEYPASHEAPEERFPQGAI